MSRILTYSELIQLPSFEERFRYLKLNGVVSDITFGSHRYLNQKLYNSKEWKDIRKYVIARDNGCDLACEGFDIFDKPIIHHINPLTIEDIVEGSEKIFDLENLITISDKTHRALHYGDYIPNEPFLHERTPGDTKLW